jgi:hypothetical protein|tara:strand:- start:193 stop:516 length:324 start_codon:yes stop_codon:yes gene_type:complete
VELAVVADQDMLALAAAVQVLLEETEAQTLEELVVLVQQLIFQLHLLQKVVAVEAELIQVRQEAVAQAAAVMVLREELEVQDQEILAEAEVLAEALQVVEVEMVDLV